MRDTNTPTIYVSSKRQHQEIWRTWRRRGHNIISTWIDLEGSWDTQTIGHDCWPRWLAEAASANYLIFYAAPWDGRHEYSLLEIGAALTAGRTILCVGVSDTMRTENGEWADFTYHPNFIRIMDLDAAFQHAGADINQTLGAVDPEHVHGSPC